MLDGVMRRGDVAEYCVSEGWIKVYKITGFAQYAQRQVILLRGKVEPFWK